MDGNLKNLETNFEQFDDGDQMKVEEALVLYLHNFSKTLIELEKSISKDFYSLIDARRMNASKIDIKMKDRELVNRCKYITHSEVNKLIEEANKKEFKSKNKINRLMIGNLEEVRKEIEEIWKKNYSK